MSDLRRLIRRANGLERNRNETFARLKKVEAERDAIRVRVVELERITSALVSILDDVLEIDCDDPRCTNRTCDYCAPRNVLITRACEMAAGAEAAKPAETASRAEAAYDVVTCIALPNRSGMLSLGRLVGNAETVKPVEIAAGAKTAKPAETATRGEEQSARSAEPAAKWQGRMYPGEISPAVSPGERRTFEDAACQLAGMVPVEIVQSAEARSAEGGARSVEDAGAVRDAYEEIDSTRSVGEMRRKLEALTAELRERTILTGLRWSRFQGTWSALARIFHISTDKWPLFERKDAAVESHASPEPGSAEPSARGAK